MSILPESAKNIRLPKMYPVIQCFPDEKISDVYSATKLELENDEIKKSINSGCNVAVLVGSRGISGLKQVVKATIEMLKSQGLEPFIVPAMGSHGGGNPKEQKKIIEDYGITEEFMGVPIKSAMDTVIIGQTQSGVPIHIDKYASDADYIVPIGRIKVHTDFDGPIESGLCKMLAIGLGKHNGCSRLHQEGFAEFHKLIPEVASTIIGIKSIPFGVAIIENAHENVYFIKAVLGENILEEEPKLLKISKSLMPRLCFEHIDVLIIEKIGKDITGAGMDPNITGRTCDGTGLFYSGPKITRIGVLDLSENTHNNAVGVGLADFVTKNLYEKFDPISTYTNAIASGNPACAKIPVVMEDENEVLLGAIQTCPKINADNAKVVRIKDTLHLINIQVSESLLKYCQSNDNFIVPQLLS